MKLIVTGGAGKHSQYVPTFGNTRAVTRALKRLDGVSLVPLASLLEQPEGP